jgi:large subunit ribosomal protein L13
VKTYSPKLRDIERRWFVVDADGAVLGRLASEVAKILRGKHKPIFAPHMDTGDHVIVINAKGIRLTGGKEDKKVYVRHSGYPGGLNRVGFSRMIDRRPAQVVQKAITGMLPKNRLGRQMARKLAVYEGATHPHEAQKPVALPLGEIPKWEGLPKPPPRPQPAPPPKGPKQKGESRARRTATGRARAASGSRTRASAEKATPPRSRAGAAVKPSQRRAQPAAKAGGAKGTARSSARGGGKSETKDKAGSRRRSRSRKEKES